MALHNVALLGGGSSLGPSIREALVSKGFMVTNFQRASSTTKYSDDVHSQIYPDDASVKDLALLLKKHSIDAVVASIRGNSSVQLRFADAAAEGGVKHFIPADFGSVDSASERALELVPLYVDKQKVLRHLKKLALQHDLRWTALVCGHFFDYGLNSGLLGFDFINKKARIFDGGNIRWSTTTIRRIGEATALILQNTEKVSNRVLYVQSFCITQNQLLQCVEKLSEQSWQIEHVSSNEFITATKQKMDLDPADHDAVEDMVAVLGITDAYWEKKDGFANSLLGLEEEDLETVVRGEIERK